MAVRYAVVTGNWSSLATWDGGASLPGPNDDVYADGKTVTIDQNATVNTVRTTNRGGGSTGGGFVLNAGCTLTCNEWGSIGGLVGGGNGSVVIFSATSGTGNINAKVTIAGDVNYNAITVSAVGGTLNFTGSLAPTGGRGINITAAATVNVTGNLISNGTTNAVPILCAGAATIVVTGNLTAGSAAAINNTGAATITITGTCTASSGSSALVNTNLSAKIKVSGPLINNGDRMAVYSSTMQIGSSSTYWHMVDYSNVPCNLYTADTIGGNPSVANVRHGTTFGPVGELVGTCYVPGAASVLACVPVDATLGTATLTAADIQAAVSSQFASVTSAIAALHDFDPVADPVAHVILADTVTTLTNAPDVPGEGEIAQAVWEYMSTLLPDGAEAMLAEIAERAAAIAARLAEQVPTGPEIVVPAPGAGQTTAWVMCYDEAGLPEEGVPITIICVKATAGGAFDATPVVLTSDENGLASGPIPRGVGLTFSAKRGTTGKPAKFAGVDADTLALPPLVGSP